MPDDYMSYLIKKLKDSGWDIDESKIKSLKDLKEFLEENEVYDKFMLYSILSRLFHSTKDYITMNYPDSDILYEVVMKIAQKFNYNDLNEAIAKSDEELRKYDIASNVLKVVTGLLDLMTEG